MTPSVYFVYTKIFIQLIQCNQPVRRMPRVAKIAFEGVSELHFF